jgi:hypothetical protein
MDTTPLWVMAEISLNERGRQRWGLTLRSGILTPARKPIDLYERQYLPDGPSLGGHLVRVLEV